MLTFSIVPGNRLLEIIIIMIIINYDSDNEPRILGYYPVVLKIKTI